MQRKKHLDKAAKELLALLEGHFQSLPPQEREAKSLAFQNAVAKIGSRAKSAGSQGTRRHE
jgi:hypothetical protein